MGLYSVIRTQPITFPHRPSVSSSLKDLISRMLCKDPQRRITLPQVMTHPWTTHSNSLPLQCRQVHARHVPACLPALCLSACLHACLHHALPNQAVTLCLDKLLDLNMYVST